MARLRFNKNELSARARTRWMPIERNRDSRRCETGGVINETSLNARARFSRKAGVKLVASDIRVNGGEGESVVRYKR